MRMLAGFLFALLLWLGGSVQAAVDVFPFETEQQEARYHRLIDRFRWVRSNSLLRLLSSLNTWPSGNKATLLARCWNS